MELRYLIISAENDCVYNVFKNAAAANGIIEGHPNSYLRTISKYNFIDFNETESILLKDKIYKSPFSSNNLIEVDASIISDQWKFEKQIIHLKKTAWIYLENHYMIAKSPFENYLWDGFSSIAWNEISQCHTDRNHYTRLIEEYALITGLSVEESYKDLKTKIEGERFVRFRIIALTEKFKNQINNIRTVDDLDKIIEGMRVDFWQKSFI